MLQYIVIVGACLQIYGGTIYAIATAKGRARPNLVTFILWAAAPLIGSAAALVDGVTWATLPVFMAGFIPLSIVIVALLSHHPRWKLRKFDYVCGLFSVLALILWGITKEPAIAIIFAIISDLLAGIPTIIKTWQHPGTEVPGPYITALIASATAFFAMTTFTFTEIAFPIYLVLFNTLILSAYYLSPHKNQS